MLSCWTILDERSVMKFLLKYKMLSISAISWDFQISIMSWGSPLKIGHLSKFWVFRFPECIASVQDLLLKAKYPKYIHTYNRNCLKYYFNRSFETLGWIQIISSHFEVSPSSFSMVQSCELNWASTTQQYCLNSWKLKRCEPDVWNVRLVQPPWSIIGYDLLSTYMHLEHEYLV